MRLRFKTSIASPRGYYHAGRVLVVDRLAPEMKEWIEAGVAVLERDPHEMETATVPPLPERADAARAKVTQPTDTPSGKRSKKTE